MDQLKDLYYALELGCDLEDPLPITAVVSQSQLSRSCHAIATPR
jgi:hypothetical protein